MKYSRFALLSSVTFLLCISYAMPVSATGTISVLVNDSDGIIPGELVQISGNLDSTDNSNQLVYVQILEPDGSLAHQDLTSTYTDITGDYSKYWSLPADSESGTWEVHVSWSENVLVQNEVDFIVGVVSIDTNVTVVKQTHPVKISGFLKGNDNSSKLIHLQVIDSKGTLIHQDLSSIYTDGIGYYELNWTVPQIGSLGWWNVSVVYSEISEIRNVTQVFVISAIEDYIDPVLDAPDDFSYVHGTSGNTITWYPTDENPLSYTITRNDSFLQSGLWDASGEPITVSVDGFDLGLHEVMIIVIDQGMNTANDTVLVTVYDSTPPTIQDLDDVEIEAGVLGTNATWTPYDSNPSRYEIYLDEELYRIGDWNSTSESIIVFFNELTLGSYNFTIIVYDAVNNKNNDTIIVTVVDGTDPSIPQISDLVISEGSTGTPITWQPFDAHPSSYSILRNNLSFRTGIWNASSDLIVVLVDGISLGVENYTLIVYDTSGNYANDTVNVYTVDDSVPYIDQPSPVEFSEGELGYSVEWHPTDSHPDEYELYLNEIQIHTGLWNSSSETISRSLDGLPYGSHNLTLLVRDVGGNIATSSVTISVLDTVVPVLDSPADFGISEGSTGHQIIWHPFDLHPSHYTITIEGIQIRSNNWNTSSEQILFSLPQLELGTYNITLFVYDESGNSGYDFVLVSVSDLTLPTIDSPIDITFVEGEVGFEIIWYAADLHPVTYLIIQDGVTIHTGNWNSSSEAISWSLDYLSHGNYTIRLRVEDIVGNYAFDDVSIIVTEPASTTFTSTPTESTGTTNTSTGTTPTDSPMVIIVIAISIGGVIIIIVVIILLRKKGMV
ncbi:MAG: hypothetical protein ACTSV2_05715 [Candidatus Thorarchaeota archaeon]